MLYLGRSQRSSAPPHKGLIAAEACRSSGIAVPTARLCISKAPVRPRPQGLSACSASRYNRRGAHVLVLLTSTRHADTGLCESGAPAAPHRAAMRIHSAGGLAPIP